MLLELIAKTGQIKKKKGGKMDRVKGWKIKDGQDFIRPSCLSCSPTNNFPLPLTSSTNAIKWNLFAKVVRA